MISVCFYFQIHQPYRLRKDYSFFHIGGDHNYEDVKSNRDILSKVAQKCYLPANKMMHELIDRTEGKFRFSLSLSGIALDQLIEYAPEALYSFQDLVKTGCVEILSETYYHSLASLYSPKEFTAQVQLHKKRIKELFNYKPQSFRNTELIYNNNLALEVEKMGYDVILTEGAHQILGWKSPNFVYQPQPAYKLKLLLKNFQLSDDIAFRFSNPDWDGYPLSAPKYAEWLHQIAGNGEVVNLFFDYETFGEHQWKETGIFDFFQKLPGEVMKHPDFDFKTVHEVAQTCQPMSKIDVPHTISWADVERDITAWTGNPLQDSALESVYKIEKAVHKTKDPELLHIWRKLQTSDHFYYMCTKWFSDGDVHKYFNPYNSPYDAYVVYVNVLNDFKEVLAQKGCSIE